MPAEVIAQTGPGAVAPKAITPAAAPVAPSAPPTAKPPEVVALEAKIAESERRARIMLQRQADKLTGEAKKEREGLSAKLGRLTELEKERATAKLNKSAYLKSLYGDDWYEQVMAEKANGGAPAADVVASELARLREEFDAKLAKRDEDAKKHSETQRNQGVEQARRQLTGDAAQLWQAKASEFPLVDGLGTPEQIASELASRVEKHYLRTTKRDDEGRILSDGEIVPLQKMAELWEAELVRLAERAAGHSKYAEKFAPKPAVVAPKDVGQPQRRTLSNDLTGSTPARSAPASEAERRARAIAAYEAKGRPTT